MDFQDGQSEVINGVTYVRQGGQWHPQTATGPVYGLPKTPTPQTQAQATQDTLQVDKLRNDLANAPVEQSMKREQLRGEQLVNQQRQQQLVQNNQQQKTGNGEQGSAAAFYARALFANQKYGKGVEPRSPMMQGIVDILPEGLVNSQTSPERQQADTWARDFVAATLRKESGAAISDQEYANQYKRYFPQPGDSPQTMADKAQLRQTALLGLRNMAGPAAQQAEQSVQQMLQAPIDPNGQGDIGFNTPSARQNPLSPQQQQAYDAFWAANPRPTREQFHAFLQQNGMGGLANEGQIMAQVEKGSQFDPNASSADLATDQRVSQRADQMMATGGTAGSAAIAGFGDAATLGSMDELGGAAQALGGALQGQGSFSDLYSINSDANRLYEQRLHDAHPWAYTGGQVAGGFAIPAGAASTPLDLAKLGAATGGVYGFNSGSGSLANRVAGGAMGAVAGGALGGAAGKVGQALQSRKVAEAIPPLVDPQTGQLNQPLEAMSPGQRVVKAEEYGVNLPADAAGGRTAAVLGKGLDIMPGSAGVMEDARRGTESQVAAASDVVASRFGNSRTMNEAGAELQRGANQRIERGKDVISKAYQAIPIADQAPTTLNNTTNTLKELTGRFQSNPDLAGVMKDGKLGAYLNAIQKGGLSWRDLKDFRSAIGEKIGEMRFGEGSSTSDLRALYGALSEDMRNSAQNAGPGALRAFERANALNRQNEEMIQGALTRILGKDGNLAPEKAAAAVQAMTKGGKSTGDLKTLAQIKAATVKSGAWNEIAATLIRLGGQPANSVGRDFNPQTFVHWYADMAEPARSMLFGNSELRTALDGFVAVNQRLQKVNALRNTSNTAGNMMAAGTVGVIGGAAMNPMMGAKMLGVMAGNYGMAKLWTNPGFVRLITGYSKAVAAGNQNAVKSQIGRLAKLATTNPELREPLIALQQRLANDNYVSRAAASPDANSAENNK